MASFWTLQSTNPDEISGEFETGEGGFLSIQSTNSDELISLPVIWGRRGSFSRGPTGIETDENYEELFGQEPDEVLWWELRTLSESGPGAGADGKINLTSVDFDNLSSDDDIFLIAGVDEETAALIRNDDTIKLRSDNPIADEAIFERLVTSEVIEVTFQSEDPSQAKDPSQSIPEPSSILGLVMIATLGLSSLRKRK